MQRKRKKIKLNLKSILISIAALCSTFGLLAQASSPNPILQVQYSVAGGFYQGDVQVALTAEEGAAIFYTTDGSKPTGKSKRYKRPLNLHRTTVLRASALHDSWLTEPNTQTYFINEDAHNMPVVSVAINPNYLFDEKTGVMMPGPKANLEKHNQPGANFWSKREFKCNTEIYEADGALIHNSGAGFRIFGGYSRLFPQKSFVLISRKRYGARRFKHKFFGKKNLKKFKYLVMRNAGSDWNGAHFRDALMSDLIDDWDVEKQDYRPALCFINGKYWGIYNIREKINTKFLADHNDLDRDSIDLLEHQNTVRAGSYAAYGSLLRLLRKKDVRNPTVYAEVQRRMDVENFMDYQIAQIYCDNADAGGNTRYWRPRKAGAKFRWILFDMDWGFGLHRKKAYAYNSLDFFTEPNGPDWPNPPWSTFILRQLLKNQDFKNTFVNRFCDRLNTCFSKEYAAAKVEAFVATLEPAMPRHLKRWKRYDADWQYSLKTIRDFVQRRPDYLQQHLSQKFDLGAMCELQLAVQEGGKVIVNDLIKVKSNGFIGEYFENLPVSLRADPKFGYRFVGWEGIENGNDAEYISVNLRAGKILRLRARFERYEHPLADQVTMNEVCAFNKYTGDWIELYNKTGQPIDLTGWSFSDGNKRFKLPKATIAPKGYAIICQDSLEFRKVFPQSKVPNVIGNFKFGLNKALEHLTIFAADGGSIDSVLYSTEPLETAFTLDLIYPSLNNDHSKNWHLQAGNGSPGEHNPIFLAEVIGAQKDFWTRIALGIGFGLVLLMFVLWKRKHG